MVKKNIIFVFANLKPSQIFYKILPLCKSEFTTKVVVLRKDQIDINNDKFICTSLPWLFKIRPLYWFVVPIYGIYLIKKHKATIILNYNIFPHGFNAFLASVFTRIPVIFAEINQDTIRYHQFFFLKPLIELIVSNAQLILVPGSHTGIYWNQVGLKNIESLHSTVDTDYYIPASTTYKNFDFIFIGEFNDNKRPDLILNAFIRILCEFKDLRICFIGYGPIRKVLVKQIKNFDLGNRVLIASSDKVLEYIQQSKIFVMASLSEGIPCSLLESMSCGLIAVVPDVGDISDVIIHGQNGFIHDNTLLGLYSIMKKSLIEYNELIQVRINARNTIISEHSYKVAKEKWNRILSHRNENSY